MPEAKFYTFEALSLKGEMVPMSTYKGQVILVVNTASKCGLTPQYEGLEKLHRQYKDKGLVVLGFPCNQFGGQEPGSSEDIAAFCELNYGVSFPMFAKVEVNGEGAHPIFQYLKAELGTWLGSRIKWNFTKFLLDRQGKPVQRFGPTVTPGTIGAAIERLL